MKLRIARGVALVLFLLGAQAARAEDTGWLGVRIGGARPVTGEDGATAPRPGIELAGVFTGSPAEAAGLRARDVVLGVDGVAVASAEDLAREVRRHAPGSWIALSVVRRGDDLSVRVRLDDRPADVSGLRLVRGWIGVEAIDLPPALREHFGAPQEAGVMISHVEPASPAEAAGFELGDVVYEVEGEPVGSVQELRSRVAGEGVGNDAEFTLMRHGSEMVLEARVDAAPERER